MSLIEVSCAHCGSTVLKEAGLVNRASKRGMRVFCGRECSGLGRRLVNPPSAAERKAAKADYDKKRREVLGEQLRAKKRAAYIASLERDEQKVRAAQKANRDARKQSHAEYCRRPEYRKWKSEYDKKYLARKQYGSFGEAAIILNKLISEINSRVSRTEIYRQNGTLNKWTQRRRQYEQQTDRR